MKQNIIYELEQEYIAKYYDESKGKWVIVNYKKPNAVLITGKLEYIITQGRGNPEINLPRINTMLHRFPKNI